MINTCGCLDGASPLPTPQRRCAGGGCWGHCVRESVSSLSSPGSQKVWKLCIPLRSLWAWGWMMCQSAALDLGQWVLWAKKCAKNGPKMAQNLRRFGCRPKTEYGPYLGRGGPKSDSERTEPTCNPPLCVVCPPRNHPKMILDDLGCQNKGLGPNLSPFGLVVACQGCQKASKTWAIRGHKWFKTGPKCASPKNKRSRTPCDAPASEMSPFWARVAPFWPPNSLKKHGKWASPGLETAVH